MDEFEQLDDDSGATVFRDVILLALAGFVTLVLLLIPHINPPVVTEDTDRSPGNVVIELRWPDEIDADIDLWVEAPGDVPVGYSNKAGTVFNLLRDDLGKTSDLTKLNYEFSYSRGVPAGKYTVNTHLYRNRARVFPVPVTVVVSVRNADDTSTRQILSAEIDMRRIGEEITALRFQLDEQGNLVAGSVHDLPRPLRSKGQS